MAAIDPAIIPVLSAFFGSIDHRRELIHGAHRHANQTASSRWTNTIVNAAIERSFRAVVLRHHLGINWSIGVRVWLTAFLVEHSFADMLAFWSHSDELMFDAVGRIAWIMEDCPTNSNPVVRQEYLQRGAVSAFRVVFNVPIGALSVVRRVAMVNTVRDRVRPVTMDPLVIPPNTTTLVRHMQAIPNDQFWPIVQAACEERVVRGPAFEFPAHLQAVLDGSPVVAHVRTNNPGWWNLRTANRGFVEAIYRRMG